MGCFQSSPADPVPKHQQYTQKPANHETTKPQPQPPQEDDVVSVPRAKVTVDDRDRAELKLKNLRDRLHRLIGQTEQVLREEGKLALRLHAEKNTASARVLLRRRKHLQDRISSADAQLNAVSDLIAGLESARDNRMLVDALNDGTRALDELNKEVTPDSIQAALDSHRDAVGYVNNVSSVLAAENSINDLNNDEFDSIMNDLSNEFGSAADTSAPVAVPSIPDVPTAVPAPPKPAAVVAPQQQDERIVEAA